MTDTALPGGSDALHRIYANRTETARAWKRGGGTVVGYFCDNVPVELILAAGCLPFRISGRPDIDLAIVEDRIDARYPPDLTGRPAFVSAILAQILSGDLSFVDYLIVPHNRHAIQAIYRSLQEAAAEYPGLSLPTLYYLDKAWSPFSEADGFNHDAVVGLREALGTWTGKTLTDAAISAAIAAVAETRAVLRRISAARVRRPSRLVGTTALHAYAAAALLPPEAFLPLADALIEQADRSPERSGLRLFVGGSPLDHDRLYAIIEELGATVVAEDHCWGARLGDDYALPAGSPIEQLSARFHQAPACSIRWSFEATIEASVERAVAADVDAAIFYVMSGDAAQGWETPDEVAALGARGIPTLHLPEQSYDCEPADALKERIGAFLAEVARDRAGATA